MNYSTTYSFLWRLIPPIVVEVFNIFLKSNNQDSDVTKMATYVISDFAPSYKNNNLTTIHGQLTNYWDNPRTWGRGWSNSAAPHRPRHSELEGWKEQLYIDHIASLQASVAPQWKVFPEHTVSPAEKEISGWTYRSLSICRLLLGILHSLLSPQRLQGNLCGLNTGNLIMMKKKGLETAST